MGERADRDARIADIKQRLMERARGHAVFGESDALPADRREDFWQHVLDFETASCTTTLERLLHAGVDLPRPTSMNDATLAAKLWQVIYGLAAVNVFLYCTDHLSDRELYSRLWNDVLRAQIPIVPDDPGVWHVDFVSGGGEAETEAYFRHYADEAARALWLRDFPGYVMPAHEDPLYNRDRHLPQSV